MYQKLYKIHVKNNFPQKNYDIFFSLMFTKRLTSQISLINLFCAIIFEQKNFYIQISQKAY